MPIGNGAVEVVVATATSFRRPVATTNKTNPKIGNCVSLR